MHTNFVKIFLDGSRGLDKWKLNGDGSKVGKIEVWLPKVMEIVIHRRSRVEYTTLSGYYESFHESMVFFNNYFNYLSKFLSGLARGRQEMPQVLFVFPLEKHLQTSSLPLCFPQVKCQVSKYPLPLFVLLRLKRDKF